MTTNTPAGTRWVSFDAPDGDTWLFDLSFFGSNWHCIYGNGCGGIEEEVDVAGQRGCCSYGAHFADDADLVRVMRVAEALPNDLWQHHARRSELDEPTLDELTRALTTLDDEGARVTTVEDGACVFLNRPGFAGGAGCAFHLAAVAAEIEPLEWKPEVCWQLPIRVEHHLDDNDHSTHFVRQWQRRDWGEAGADLAWWCSEAAEAFTGTSTVATYLRAEIVALAGVEIADALVEHVASELRNDVALADVPVAISSRPTSGQ